LTNYGANGTTVNDHLYTKEPENNTCTDLPTGSSIILKFKGETRLVLTLTIHPFKEELVGTGGAVTPASSQQTTQARPSEAATRATISAALESAAQDELSARSSQPKSAAKSSQVNDAADAPLPTIGGSAVASQTSQAAPKDALSSPGKSQTSQQSDKRLSQSQGLSQGDSSHGRRASAAAKSTPPVSSFYAEQQAQEQAQPKATVAPAPAPAQAPAVTEENIVSPVRSQNARGACETSIGSASSVASGLAERVMYLQSKNDELEDTLQDSQKLHRTELSTLRKQLSAEVAKSASLQTLVDEAAEQSVSLQNELQIDLARKTKQLEERKNTSSELTQALNLELEERTKVERRNAELAQQLGQLAAENATLEELLAVANKSITTLQVKDKHFLRILAVCQEALGEDSSPLLQIEGGESAVLAQTQVYSQRQSQSQSQSQGQGDAQRKRERGDTSSSDTNHLAKAKSILFSAEKDKDNGNGNGTGSKGAKKSSSVAMSQDSGTSSLTGNKRAMEFGDHDIDLTRNGTDAKKDDDDDDEEEDNDEHSTNSEGEKVEGKGKKIAINKAVSAALRMENTKRLRPSSQN